MLWIPSPRADGRMEWICEHGVGHGNHVHGCCHEGCCGRDDFPGKKIQNDWDWDDVIMIHASTKVIKTVNQREVKEDG